MIETDEGNKARDLFIRLQGGQPLNHQETRDAWPGAFTDFILKLGGKPDVPRYPGHHFFQRLLGMKPKSDRGKTRMLAAQLTMLFIERRRSGSWKLPGINNQDLNDYYYDNLDFDEKSENSLQLIETLNLLENILVGKNLPKLRAHDAMHALMLVDELRQGYASGWQADFASALENFMMRLVRAKKSNETGEFDEYWMEYGQWTRTNSDKGDNILRRHRFYTSKMVRGMGKLKPIDNARFFGDLQRKILFFDQGKICTVCMKEINFDDMEIHHITPHSKRGQTTIQNGAIVHSYCHPKSDKDVALFDEAWKSRKVFIDNKRKGIIEFSDGKIAKNEGADFEQDGVVVPHGTPARMEYKNGDQLYQGHFEDGVLMVDGLAYNSLSSAASALAITNDGKKTSLNGWLYWSVLLPGTSEWVSLKKLRDQMDSED
jgi:5-methylcytosine-specific restriction endonuclease McrA